MAADNDSRERGAMVVMNDRIVSAFFATKTQANTVDTFKAYEMGNIGMIVSNKPYFFYPAVQPNAKHVVDVAAVEDVPRVDILYAYEEMQSDLIYSAVEHGAKGIVVCLSFYYSIEILYGAMLTEIGRRCRRRRRLYCLRHGNQRHCH